MPKIIQLSQHVANLIAAGEVVERPASVAKELLENAVDAGATQVTLEIRDGGMTFLRVTDNGCGMSLEDARTAFLRHATSKLKTAEDLAAISTMGFRGEALAAIASVSRIDLLTKLTGAVAGTSLTLEAGVITDEGEAGCPEGTTIIIRDLFYNTPARMKFMKSDSVEGARVTAAVQLQALAHPEVAFRYIKDSKELLSTPGTGKLQDAVYAVYGKEFGRMVAVNSAWEGYQLTGFVCKSTDARPSRSMQTFFVNGRPVKSRLLMAALEEAYRNQIMQGKFPACVLHLNIPVNVVDVNVHPAKTEVKFLNEKAVFDCVHYGVLGGLNNVQDRPQVQLKPPVPSTPVTPLQPATYKAPKQDSFFRTMDAKEYKAFLGAVATAPKPEQTAAIKTANAVRQEVVLPKLDPLPAKPEPQPVIAEPEQEVMPMPEITPWRMVGELYNAYILVEQGEEGFIIDKHAAHERILFEKLKANQETISAQALITPIQVKLHADQAAELLDNAGMLTQLGFEIEEFGTNTVLVRQIPMDLAPEQTADTLETMAADLLSGRREKATTVRDEILHTVACKAAIKAGWKTDSRELQVLVDTVMGRDDLKHCPHGRPICITLSKKQLEKNFKR